MEKRRDETSRTAEATRTWARVDLELASRDMKGKEKTLGAAGARRVSRVGVQIVDQSVVRVG